MVNRYNYSAIPSELMAGLRRYIEERIETGSFLRAVLENDLRGAVTHGNDAVIPHLPALVYYLYNECPSACWGSETKVQKWIDDKPDGGEPA